jgi:uncharacterized protein (DUF1697 family)
VSICVALIRGINVGRGNRVAMADLRAMVGDLGHTEVRSLLNSGNIIFECKRPNVAKIALDIQTAIVANCGFSASVMVVTSQDLDRIIGENPLLHTVNDHARHLIAFVAHSKHLEPLRRLLKDSWKPDALAITPHAAYIWCAGGILESRLLQSISRAAGDTITTRNWATVLKLQAAAKQAT